jgi:hypothetical protein
MACSRLASYRVLHLIFTWYLHFIPTEAKADPNHYLDDSTKFITVSVLLVAIWSPVKYIVQRPDIEAPNFTVTIYDESRISPGYWFIPSYDFLDQSVQNGGRWTAPHIFDKNGELIWSGAVWARV